MKFKKLAAALALAALAGSALAQSTEGGTLTVNATVAGSCAVGDATLAFNVAPAVNADGTGSQSAGAITSSTTVPVICTTGQDGAISADNGANYDATDSVRRMRVGATATSLAYGLYTDSNSTTAFNTTNTIAVTGQGTSENKTIYGKIEAADATAAPKGSYTDSVALTITYTP